MADEVEHHNVNDDVNITPEIKEYLRGLRRIFDNFTREETKDWAALAQQGIYPLYVGTGNNRQFRGFRLGSAVAKESDSVCFQAMIHNNEPAGLAGLDKVLQWWGQRSAHEKNNLPGDIYLMFAGERQQSEAFFNTLERENTISRKDLSEFRGCTKTQGEEHGVNRNRLPAEKPADNAPIAQRNLWDDYQWLNENVYKKCKGEPPGFILGFHTSAQPIE